MIKWIATDMDGTLLHSNHGISEENIRAIQHARENGVGVVVATGRIYKFACLPLKNAGLKLPVISLNGAQIHSEDGKCLLSIPLSVEQTKKIYQILNKESIYFEVYTNRALVANSRWQALKMLKTLKGNGSWFRIFSGIQHHFFNREVQFIPVFPERLEKEVIDCYKFIIFSQDPEKLESVKQKLAIVPDLAISSSSSVNLEITHRKAQKGLALETFAHMNGASLNEVMAIGDGGNDKSMLEKAGFSVAMGNAADELLKIADYVTSSNDEHGFARAVEKVLEINQSEQIHSKIR